MERLLEAVLGSILRDYVHSSKETESGAFKASWTARGISLHDINLNINKINLPRVTLRKATAKSLEVKIPWASLATQAIEVHIAGVELSADGDVTVSTSSVQAPLAKPWDNWPDPSDCRNSSSSGDSSGGWVGDSIQSRLLRTALQISVFIDGVSVAVFDGPDSLTCQVGSFSLTNLALDELLDFVKNPRCWFNKGLCLRSANIAWNKSGTMVARLSVDSIQISALLPSRLFLSNDKHEDQFLIPLGVEVSSIDLDLFDGFFEAFREKIQAAGNQNGNTMNGSDQNFFRSFSSFMNLNGTLWALDWGLSISTIKVNVHVGDLRQDEFTLPDTNLLTILCQNIIHRCSLEGRNIEILFALGSASMRFHDRKIDMAYSIFSAIPFRDFRTEHAITATIRSDRFEETIFKLNCTKIDVNIPWECEAYGRHIMNTWRDEIPASSRSQDEVPSVARKLFSEVAVEIHDLDISISNQDDRLSLVLKNVHVSRDVSGSVNAAAYLILAHLSSSSDRGAVTEKISNSVHFCFEVTPDGWKYSWDPLRICLETGSALARLTSCLTGNQNCHKFPSLPVSIKIEIGSDGFTSNARGNAGQVSVCSTMDLTLGIDDQALSFQSSFEIKRAGNVWSMFLSASEIDLVKSFGDHQRSILRVFLSDMILRQSNASKSCLLGCIAIDALAISSDFSSMFLIFEYLSLHYIQNSPPSGKESTANCNEHESFRVETLSLTLTSSRQEDAMCIWLSDASFVKQLDKEDFRIQDGGIHLKRRQDVIECLSFARPNPTSPVTKSIMKSGDLGEIDRDLEVLDLEIKVYPSMPILLGEVMAMKNCLQNTWKNIKLSIDPSKIRNSHCSIQSSMMVRIGCLDVSLLQDESSSAEIQLVLHFREVCAHYIQKSLINNRFWLDSILNTENDAKLLVWIESGSVSTSGNSGHATPLVLPFSLFLSAYTWPIGNRKFISASTSHVVFQVDMCSLKGISSMLRSYSPNKDVNDNEYCPDNEVLKIFDSDDDLRSRPSLLSRTCDGELFEAEESVEIIVHGISAHSFSWTYRNPRSVNRLHFKDAAIMPVFIGSCFKLSCIGLLEDKEIVKEAFTVDSNDFLLRLKTVQPSCEWRLSWDKKMEEEDLILLLKSISIFSSSADLKHSPLNCSVSFSFLAPKITAKFLAISWPFGECLGGHRGVNVLSEFSWLEPNISMTSHHQLIQISGSGKICLDYTDPFDFTPLRLMDCTDLTASYTFMLQDREDSWRDNDESIVCGAMETVENHALCLDTNSRINLITSRYVLYDLQHLWKLASEAFPFYPLTIRNNSSSHVSVKQLGCSEEIGLGINDDKWYPLHHNKPKFLQFSCESQSKTTWSRGVHILQEQSLRIDIPPTGVLSVKIVRTHSGGVIATLNDGLYLKNSTTKLTFVCLNGQELRLDPGQKCSAPSTECELRIKLSNGWSDRFCLDSESKIVEAENPTETLDIDTFPAPPVLINGGSCVSDYVYHICYPVTLKNSLDQNLAISGRADTAETRILLKESSMDLILSESGGKVCTFSREHRHAREEFVGLFCPGYETQEGGNSRNQISHLTQSEILAPTPGQCTRLSIPPEHADWDGKPPTNVILQSCVTPYNTLELKFLNELYLCNATCRTVKFLMDTGEFLVHPFQTLGTNAPMANFLRVAISPFQDHGDVWYTSSSIDATMSSQMIIDATDQDTQRSVKLFIDIDIASQYPSKIALKPFYYISNMTSYVLSHGVEKVPGTETKPLLSPLDFRAQTIKIKQMKHKKDGKMILVDYLILSLQEKDRVNGNTEGLTCKTVRKPDMVHFIVMPDSTELMVRNKLDVQVCIDVLSRDKEMLRSYHLEQDSQTTLHLGHSDASLQVRVDESTYIVDTVTKMAVGDVVRYQHFLIRRTNLHSIEIRHVGRSYKQKISQYSLRCSRFSVLFHSRPQNGEEDRILELELEGISVRLQTNAALETYSTDFRIDKYSMSLEALSSRSNIIIAESPAATMNCQGFLTDILKHHKIDAIEGSLGTLFVAVEDATIEALVDILNSFRAGEVHSSLTDDTFVELQDMKKTPVSIQKFLLKPINILLDSRLSRSAWLPFAINTSRAPISVAAMSYEGERSLYEIVRLLREDIGDSLFRSAPYLIGSLQLLFDPVGMFRSLRRGFSHIVNLPVEGIRKKSLTSFLSGVGHGSANFFKEISGWSYSTAIGFSKSIADILRKNPSITERKSRKEQEFIEEADVRMSRPLVYGVQNLVNLSSRLGTVFWYRDILEAKVSLKTDPKLSIKIVSPALLIHDKGLVVFAHWGTTASFQILSTCDSEIYAVNGTHEMIIESEHCTTFGGHENQQSRESIIKLCIDPDDFETVSLIFKQVWGGHTSSK